MVPNLPLSRWQMGWIKFLAYFGIVALGLVLVASAIIAIPLILLVAPFVMTYVVVRTALSAVFDRRNGAVSAHLARMQDQLKNLNELVDLHGKEAVAPLTDSSWRTRLRPTSNSPHH